MDLFKCGEYLKEPTQKVHESHRTVNSLSSLGQHKPEKKSKATHSTPATTRKRPSSTPTDNSRAMSDRDAPSSHSNVKGNSLFVAQHSNARMMPSSTFSPSQARSTNWQGSVPPSLYSADSYFESMEQEKEPNIISDDENISQFKPPLSDDDISVEKTRKLSSFDLSFDRMNLSFESMGSFSGVWSSFGRQPRQSQKQQQQQHQLPPHEEQAPSLRMSGSEESEDSANSTGRTASIESSPSSESNEGHGYDRYASVHEHDVESHPKSMDTAEKTNEKNDINQAQTDGNRDERSNSRTSSTKSKKQHHRHHEESDTEHIEWFAHGHLWTAVGVFFSLSGIIMAILARQSTAFVKLDHPIYLDPNFDTVEELGMVRLRLCYNESFVDKTGCLIHDLDSDDVEDRMFQLSRSLLTLAVLLGAFLTVFLTSAIFWKSINLRPIGVGYLVTYFLESFAFLFFDTELCATHQCHIGPGCTYAIFASVCWVVTCVATSRMDAHKYNEMRAKRKRMRDVKRKKLNKSIPLEREISNTTQETESTFTSIGVVNGIDDVEASRAWLARKQPDGTTTRSRPEVDRKYRRSKSAPIQDDFIRTQRDPGLNRHDSNKVDATSRLKNARRQRGSSLEHLRRSNPSSVETLRQERSSIHVKHGSQTSRESRYKQDSSTRQSTSSHSEESWTRQQPVSTA